MRIVGVTLGWDGRPTLLFENGRILPRDWEKLRFPEYYPTGKDGEWPVDPKTGEKLKAAWKNPKLPINIY